MTRSVFLFVLAMLCGLLGGSATAANVAGLYETVVTVNDNQRETAFVEALRQIAVRVSGSRDAADRVMTVKPDARRYVQQFSFPGEGTAVTFDTAKFDQLLTSAGLPIWGRERPATLVWLYAPDAAGRPAWQGTMDHGAERELIEKVALARGMPLIWPTMDATDRSTATSLGSGARSFDELTASSERYRADAVLVGTPARDAAGTAVMRWTFAFNGEAIDLTSSLEEGVHQVADRFASVLAVAAGVRGTVALQVTGVRDLDAYARTLNYLEGLTVVRSVAVEQLQGDKLDVQVAVRGDAAVLRRTIGLSKRLIPVDGAAPAGATERLKYQFQP